MFDGNLILIVVIGLILAAEFVNGWTDSPNAIATVVSTRVLSPYQAVIMATVLNAVGAMSGTAVAATIGQDIVRADVINLTTVGAAMVGIIFWSTLAWYYGMPTSDGRTVKLSVVRLEQSFNRAFVLNVLRFFQRPFAYDPIIPRACQ